jgi:hypothetical protein
LVTNYQLPIWPYQFWQYQLSIPIPKYQLTANRTGLSHSLCTFFTWVLILLSWQQGGIVDMDLSYTLYGEMYTKNYYLDSADWNISYIFVLFNAILCGFECVLYIFYIMKHKAASSREKKVACSKNVPQPIPD